MSEQPMELASSGREALQARVGAEVDQLVSEVLADSSKRAYRTGWGHFQTWCGQQQVASLPADPFTVAAWLADEREQTRWDGQPRWSVGSLRLWLAAINWVHQRAGFPQPVVAGNVASDAFTALRRRRGSRPKRVAAAGLDTVTLMLDAMDFTTWPAAVKAHRDAAILLVGLAGALRRSELAALDVSDATPQPQGAVHLLVRRSKTDQEGEGLVKYLPRGEHPELCPSCALWRWVKLLRMTDKGMSRAAMMAAVMETSRTIHVCQDRWVQDSYDPGSHVPLFRPVHRTGFIVESSVSPPDGEVPARSRFARPDGRWAGISGQTIHQMLRQRAAAAGLNADLFGGHSLRAGFVTDAFNAGADVVAVKRQSGHKSDAALGVYDRENTPGRGNAVTKLGF